MVKAPRVAPRRRRSAELRRRSARGRRLSALSLALCLLASAQPALAADEYPLEDRVFDAAVFRPMGFLGTVVGFAFFVVSLPISGPVMKADQAWERFVQQPADFTFHRELGDF